MFIHSHIYAFGFKYKNKSGVFENFSWIPYAQGEIMMFSKGNRVDCYDHGKSRDRGKKQHTVKYTEDTIYKHPMLQALYLVGLPSTNYKKFNVNIKLYAI